jgi:phosphate transport system substrate-binding protein
LNHESPGKLLARLANRKISDHQLYKINQEHDMKAKNKMRVNNSRLKKLFACVAAAAMAIAATTAFAVQKDYQDLPVYQKARGISGDLSSEGADTLANLMALWAEDFKRHYPNVNIQIQAYGSSTAPPALIEGTTILGMMSRKMGDKEIAYFQQKYGYQPTEIPVAIDALAVYINKDNPIKGLTMPQVDAIFSTIRACGYIQDITKWGQLGVTGHLGEQNIQLFGRNAVSGTYGYFKENALCKGDYRNSVNTQPSSMSVVQHVSESVNGIGYSSFGYKTAKVRAVPLAKKDGDPFVEATPENAATGEYPLLRFLYIYTNKAPNKALIPIVREFVKFVLSQQGQEIVIKDGFVPLPVAVVNEALKSLDLN